MSNNISSINCSPIRPSFGQEQMSRNKTIDWERAADILNGIDVKNMDERSAKNIEKLAAAINETEENKRYTKPLKQFLTTVSLALASGIVAKGSATKFVQAIEKNVPVLDWISKEATRFGKQIKIKVSDERNFKGFVSRLADDSMTWLKNFAQKGLKNEVVQDFVEKNAKDLMNAQEVAFLKEAAVTQNGLKKVISNTAGVSGGIYTIGQTTKDKNKDGIPDMYQGKEAKEDILRDKLIDAAIETITS